MGRSRRSRSSRHAAKASFDPLALAGRMADFLVIAAFFLLLVVSPLLMGGNRDWAWAPMTLLVGALAVLVALGLGNPQGAPIVRGEGWPLAALIACFVVMLGLGLLQMTTLLPAGPSGAFYRKAAEILGRAHAPVASLGASTPTYTIIRCMACALIFAISRALCADERRARLLLMMLMASAFLVMIYALLELPVSSCFVGNYLKKQGEYKAGVDHCTMSGTFVNSNSFACFLGMALAAAIGLVAVDVRSRRRSVRRSESYERDYEEEGRLVAWMTGPRLTIIAFALLFAGGTLMSGSRAGFATIVVSLFLLGLLLMRGRWRSRRHFGATMVGAVVGGLLMLGLAGGAFVQKMSTFSQASSFDRLIIWRTTLQAIEKSPWLGWGFGSFSDIYTVLQPRQIPIANDKAHSTPLETILELGIPGGSIAILVVLISWMMVCRGAMRRHRRQLPAAAFAASAVAILHSSVDFSLQMPAIAFFTSALLGMGWAQTFAPVESPSRPFTEPAS